jgi:hypothetical protein
LRSNAAVDFVISDADMETLKNARAIVDYGEARAFPVFGKKRQIDGASEATPHGAGIQRGHIG